jgi:hypothetical protein
MGRRAYLPVGRQEKWYFSIIDVISALTGNDRPRKYWNDLKTKLKEEGSELSQNMGQLKLPAEDGNAVAQYVMVRSSHTTHRSDTYRTKRIVARALTTSKFISACGPI